MEKDKAIGLVGIGNIGLFVAERLIGAGLQVIGYSKPWPEAFAAIGGEVAREPSAILRATSIVLCCLPDETAARDVYLGAKGLLADISAGQVILDLSTYALNFKLELAAEAAAKRALLLDGEVSGTPDMLRQGLGSIFMAGDAKACDDWLWVCKLIAAESLYVGPFGSASKLKLINNLLSAVHTVAAAEAMALGGKAGFEPAFLAQVLSKGSGSSKFLASRAPLMATRQFDKSMGTLNLFSKYLKYIPVLAKEADAATPLFDTASACLEVAMQKGFGNADIAAVFEILDSMQHGRVKDAAF